MFGDFPDHRGVYATHVDGQFGDVFGVFHEELEALLHEEVDLEEVCGDHDGDDVVLREVFLHEQTPALVLALLVGALLQTQTPLSAPEAPDGGALVARVLQFHDVFQQPLEDHRVAVDADIDLVLVADLLETLVKVLHMFAQEGSSEDEVLLNLFIIVDHVDADFISEHHLVQHDVLRAFGRLGRGLHCDGLGFGGGGARDHGAGVC